MVLFGIFVLVTLIWVTCTVEFNAVGECSDFLEYPTHPGWQYLARLSFVVSIFLMFVSPLEYEFETHCFCNYVYAVVVNAVIVWVEFLAVSLYFLLKK